MHDVTAMFEDMAPGELLERVRSGELWQLLDVREPWEVEKACIAQSPQLPIINIPMAEIAMKLSELEQSRPLAVLCHSGGRSARVAAYLVQQGFQHVANVRGGIDAWSGEIDPTIPRY